MGGVHRTKELHPFERATELARFDKLAQPTPAELGPRWCEPFGARLGEHDRETLRQPTHTMKTNASERRAAQRMKRVHLDTLFRQGGCGVDMVLRDPEP